MTGPKLPTANVVQFPRPTRPRSAGCIALRHLVSASGLTQDRAAEVMGTPGRTLRRWLAGESEPEVTPFLRLQDYVQGLRVAA